MKTYAEHKAASPLTTSANFCDIPAAGKHLMEIAPGLETDFALSKAECLDQAVRQLLTKAVNEGGLDVDIAFLCEFALDAAGALRFASGVTP